MKRILIIATGGTIACVRSDDGLVPQMDPSKVLDFVPEIFKICDVELLQLFSIDSSNMYDMHWLKIAETVEKNYSRYDGFVIMHGTDTMAYTAAALSYLLQNISKPVVITGAQQPIERSISDGRLNLLNSVYYAASRNAFGVVIMFNGKVIAGTRARKVRTKSYNAFSSIDFPEIAQVQEGHIIRYITGERPEGEPEFYHHMRGRIFPLRLIPGMDPHGLCDLQDRYDAMIIESFGIGGIPEYELNGGSYAEVIGTWLRAGKVVVVTTQVPHEGSDMAVYHVGMHIKEKYEIIEAYDMTFEATVTKLKWILARTSDIRKIKELFYKPINYDIIPEDGTDERSIVH
jgi:L-asparaginase